MKNLLLYFTVLTLVGCSNFSRNSPSVNCPAKPDGVLVNSQITKITSLGTEPTEVSAQVRSGQYIGYTFNAKLGQRLEYVTKEDLCVWIYAPDNQILSDISSLPKTGKYTIQLSTFKGATTFSLIMRLYTPTPKSSPKPSPKPSVPSSVQPSPKPSVPSSIQLTPKSNKLVVQPVISETRAKIDYFDKVFLPLLISVLATILSALFFEVKSLKRYIIEAKKNKEIGELKLFWSNGQPLVGSRERYHIIFGVDLQKIDETVELRSEYARAFGICEIKNILEKIYDKNVDIELHPLKKSEKVKPGIFNDHVIIIGGEFYIENLGNFYEKVAIPVRKQKGNLVEIRKQKQEELKKSKLEGQRISFDYGSVVRIADANTKKLIIAFDGNHETGVIGAIKLATTVDNNGFSKKSHIFLKYNYDKNYPAQQLVIEVTNRMNGDVLDIESIDPHTRVEWDHFVLDPAMLAEAIRDICGQNTKT